MLGTRFHVVSITPPVSSDGVSSALSLYSGVFIPPVRRINRCFIHPEANAANHVGNLNRIHGVDISTTYLQHFCAPKAISKPKHRLSAS